MRFMEGQVRQLRESATSLSEQTRGIDVHFAQPEEAAPVTTVRYDEDPPMGAYLGENPSAPQIQLHLRRDQVMEETIAMWRMLGVPHPVRKDFGYRELGGRSVHEWTVTAPGVQ